LKLQTVTAVAAVRQRRIRAMTDADDDADFAEAFRMRHARLRTLRVLVGLTEQEMAVRMGMSERAYSAWETPERSSRGFRCSRSDWRSGSGCLSIG
jgi:DNA-binding transcriptional regulator YiaG